MDRVMTSPVHQHIFRTSNTEDCAKMGGVLNKTGNEEVKSWP